MHENRFTLEIENKVFNFEIGREDRLVWLINDNDPNEKTNIGQTRPTTDINDAKEIAKLMLYSMRLIAKI